MTSVESELRTQPKPRVVIPPRGHDWYPPVRTSQGGYLSGRCECGSEYDDVQVWATHISLVREYRIIKFIDKWRPRLGGFVIGIGFVFVCQWVSAHV